MRDGGGRDKRLFVRERETLPECARGTQGKSPLRVLQPGLATVNSMPWVVFLHI